MMYLRLSDAIFGEEDNVLGQLGGWEGVIGTEAAVFREHFDGAIVQEVLVFSEHVSHVFHRV